MSIPTIIKKEALLQWGKMLPKNDAFNPLRNRIAAGYHYLRQTPAGADLARVLYDNAELVPHSVITWPIPIYPTEGINALWALTTSKNKSAKYKTIKSLTVAAKNGLSEKFKDVLDADSVSPHGMAHNVSGY